MEGYPYQSPTPTAVTMGSLVSTILQVKTQLDFMDQFLSLYNPDYVRFKNYAIATQRNGAAASVVPSTASSYTASVAPPLSTHQAPIPSFSTGGVVNPALGNQMAANIMRNGTTYAFLPSEKAKPRRKQSLILKNSSAPAIIPAPANRRGRKRKYNIENPSNCQNVPPPIIRPPSSENIIKICVPAPPSQANYAADTGTRGATTPSTFPPSATNGKKIMSSLDVLAAVSYVLKQNESVSLAREMLSSSTSNAPITGNQEPRHSQSSEQFKYSSAIPISPYQQNQTNRQMDGQEKDFTDKNGHGLNGSAEGQQPQELQVDRQLYETAREDFRTDNAMFRLRSPVLGTSNEITRSQEEDIVGRPPEHEIVISGGGTSDGS